MGSNFANDLSVMDSLDIETQIGIHLSANHYPPVPKTMIRPCIEAIDALIDPTANPGSRVFVALLIDFAVFVNLAH